MLDRTTHDFGTVARGAKVEHRFTIENIYEEDVHIQSLSSSCGCSTPQASRRLLKTWEKAEILVALDTRGFLGRKDSTITVVFDRPFPAEVQLHIHAYIRSDIVVQPGAVSFGSVMQGAGARREVTVSSAGGGDWRIEKIECDNPCNEAEAVEIQRSAGQTAYRLAVQLKPDAPPGYLRDSLILVTNDFDPRAARVPVAVEGLVAAALSVRPSPLSMGVAEIGRPVTRNLVVQGPTAFRIVAVRASDPRFQCKPPTGAKTVHVLPVTFLAPLEPSAAAPIRARLNIETDMAGAGKAEVDVSVQLAPPKPLEPPSRSDQNVIRDRNQ